MKKWLLVIVFSLVGFSVFAQCPMCRKGAEGSNYAKKLNTGILYLLSFPIVMAAGFGTFWYLNRKKFHSGEENQDENDLLSNIHPN